jgi:hypothetical protein
MRTWNWPTLVLIHRAFNIRLTPYGMGWDVRLTPKNIFMVRALDLTTSLGVSRLRGLLLMKKPENLCNMLYLKLV